jgi:dTDP-4-amino-4,6-dideoxygalactose transaminase
VDLDAFTALGARHGLTIIEDAAQAHGAAYKGRPVGAIGDLGTFSFQSSKNITAGEGGAILTDSPELAGAVYSLVNVGRVPGGGWYQHEAVGYNLRLTEFQAAILRVQLRRHPKLQELRERNAQLLTRLLNEVEGIQLAPEDPAITAHGRHLFMLRVPGRRDTVLQSLAAAGLTRASSGYVPLHRNAAVLRESKAITDKLGQPYPEPHCPNADKVCTDTIWLPQPYLLTTEPQTRAIATTITNAVTP